MASPWTKSLLILKEEIQEKLEFETNFVLCNLYRNGHDSMGKHRDDEKELGPNPKILSLSLGANRTFRLRKIKEKASKLDLLLENGDLVIMENRFNHLWTHEIPKEKKILNSRINLTFRKIDYFFKGGHKNLQPL